MQEGALGEIENGIEDLMQRIDVLLEIIMGHELDIYLHLKLVSIHNELKNLAEKTIADILGRGSGEPIFFYDLPKYPDDPRAKVLPVTNEELE